MKKITVLAILMVGVLVLNAQSLKTSLGLVARVNVSTFRTNNTLRVSEITANPEVGLNFTVPASPTFAISIEGLYVQTGGRYGTFDDRPKAYDLRLRYAKLPLSLQIGKGDFKVKVGYYEAYLLDKVTIGSSYNKNYSFLSSHWIANRSDRGITGGFDVDLHGGGDLNAILWTTQGTYSLRRTGNGPNYPLWNERLVSISTGLKYNF